LAQPFGQVDWLGGTLMAMRNSGAEKAVKWAVVVGGLSVFVYSVYKLAVATADASMLQWLLLGTFTVLVVSRIDLRIAKSPGTVTISEGFIFASLFLFGVFPSVVLAGIDAAVGSLNTEERRRAIPFNTAVVSLSVYLSGIVATMLFGDLSAAAGNTGNLVVAAGVLALLQISFGSILVAIVDLARTGIDRASGWRDYLAFTSISYLSGGLAACLVIKLISVTSFSAVLIALPTLLCAYVAYLLYVDRSGSSAVQTDQMADLHLRTIEALAIAIDAKDEVTHDHVRRVQVYATGLGRLFSLSEPEIEALRAAALLHDIGKLAVPDHILNKPGALTPDELEKMQVHTTVGADILERVGFPYPVVPVVRHHHERWDGRGYPDQLMADQIPITARILTVTDCFDTVREERHYRKAMTRAEAVGLLKDGSGTIFDPEVVRVFLDHLAEFESEIRQEHIQLKPFGHPIESRLSAASILPDSGRMAFERIRVAHSEVTSLYDVAQKISNNLDLKDVLAVFASRLQDIVKYSTCIFFLQKPNSTDLEAAHVAGRNAEKLKGRTLASGAGMAGWVAASRQPLCNCDPRLDFAALKVELEETYTTAIVAPLLRNGEVLGALAVYSTELDEYEPEHLRLIEAVAKLASDTLAVGSDRESSPANTLTDPMTGLPNARALRHRFEHEADRARRHQDTFCILMMDVDGLKAVNDALGHQHGDNVIRLVARMLSNQLRSSDFIGRYSDDDFVAILHVEAEEAAEIARRIQQAVDKYDFGLSGSSLVTGISIGWSCFGPEGQSLDELLLRADRAMLTDKSRRKAAPTAEATGKKGPPDSYHIN
jgi:diguanylate cyclase (GGDEF)-like protein/putative nucleotidyltransferase with HDIG domain